MTHSEKRITQRTLSVNSLQQKGGETVANTDIRREAKAKGVKLWEVAAELEISESSMTRLLRQELALGEKARVLSAINRIAKRTEGQR